MKNSKSRVYLGDDGHVHTRPLPGIGTGMNAIGSAVNAANASLKPNRPKPVTKPARPTSVTNFRTSDAPAKPAPKPKQPEKTTGSFGQQSSTGSFSQSKPKNDKFLGRPGKGNAKTEAADKKADKNKSLIKGFEGARTFKDKDGKVRPTKEWAAYLKKNGSDVVSKGAPKRDHISQMINGRKKG